MRAQTVNVKLSVVSLAPPRLRVEGTRADAATVWSFRSTYAGLLGLGARVSQLTLADAQGAAVPVRQLAPGEYEATRAANSFSYEVSLDPPAAAADAAHISWLAAEHGVLMLGDLLPLTPAAAQVQLMLPAGWHCATLEPLRPDGSYLVTQPAASIFFIARELRVQQRRVGELRLDLGSTGAWAFSDQEIASAAEAILREHMRTTGSVPQPRALLIVAPFPRSVPVQLWSAETRGGTVLLLSGRVPGHTAALVQLSQPLVHELFHLWVPNGLSLTGDYAWFYEGFTLYQAVRASVRLGYADFQNYLDNLALAYDQAKAAPGENGLSLLDSSGRRWSGGTAAVYYKGMLVAYLYDLTVRQRSGGKHSLDDVYRALFRPRSGSTGRAGNEVLLALLNSVAASPELTAQYVERGGELKLAAVLQPFGLQVQTAGARTRISVAGQLSRAQRDLLRQIGYNAAGPARGRK